MHGKAFTWAVVEAVHGQREISLVLHVIGTALAFAITLLAESLMIMPL